MLEMQYRAAALAGVMTQFFWGMINIMIFEAFYRSSVFRPAMTMAELTTYIWLQQAFLVLIMLWIRDNTLFEMIRSGNVAYELLRPVETYYFWYFKLLAHRMSGALMRCLPILLVALLLPKPYRFVIPSDMLTFALFVVTLTLGVAITVAISMFIYISVFVTLSPRGSVLIFAVIGEFFAGLVIPIPLMPEWLRNFVYLLPFRYTGDLPFRIFTGNIGHAEAFQGLLMQCFWMISLIAVGRFLMNRVLNQLVVQGG
ncbi:ABC transporter permease [Fusibacter ferrireducens]|nr:ABC transporter permease [Fusibacter ferrireducens]